MARGDARRAARRARGEAQADPGDALRTALRPYQREGLRWLWLLSRLGLGGCLADDMGLGKTIQVLALLLLLKRHRAIPGPHLLVVPASLLANWKAEAARFAPSLRVLVAHPSAMPREELAGLGPGAMRATASSHAGRRPSGRRAGRARRGPPQPFALVAHG